VLPGILSAYTLAYHKPGIVLFEGAEAIRRIQEDSLTATGEILQVIDSEAVEKYMAQVNADYVKARLKAGIRKRLLVPDTAYNRATDGYPAGKYAELTQVRFLSQPMPTFHTSWLLYDKKVSYLTLQPDSTVGVLLEDPSISLMHRSLFEMLWSSARPA
jgi:hypothetical protein